MATGSRLLLLSDPDGIDDSTLVYPPNPTPWRAVTAHDGKFGVVDAEGHTVFFKIDAEEAYEIVARANSCEPGGVGFKP